MTSASESVHRPQATEGAWRALADGVFVLVGEPDSVNIGLVVGTTGALLIDCGSTPAQGRRLQALASTVTGVPLIGAVVTHEHRDHWFGLAGLDGLDSWGHETLVERIGDPGVLAEAERLGVAPAELRPPSRTFSQVAVVQLGDRRVELLHLGAAHTPADIVAYVPDADVVFTGDLVEQPHPWLGPESSPRGWPAALNLLVGLLQPATVVVPGHGGPVDRDFVVRQLADLAALPYEAERLVRDGVPLDRAEAQGAWPFPWPAIAPGVRTAYAELAAGGVRPRLPLV